jgi:hypothetical protein
MTNSRQDQPLPFRPPRSWEEAEEWWTAHVAWIMAQPGGGRPVNVAHREMMLARQREDFDARRFPFTWDIPERTPAPGRDEVKAVIDTIIAENGGKPIGINKLGPLVRARLPNAPHKHIEELRPQVTRKGRPPSR